MYYYGIVNYAFSSRFTPGRIWTVNKIREVVGKKFIIGILFSNWGVDEEMIPQPAFFIKFMELNSLLIYAYPTDTNIFPWSSVLLNEGSGVSENIGEFLSNTRLVYCTTSTNDAEDMTWINIWQMHDRVLKHIWCTFLLSRNLKKCGFDNRIIFYLYIKFICV